LTSAKIGRGHNSSHDRRDDLNSIASAEGSRRVDTLSISAIEFEIPDRRPPLNPFQACPNEASKALACVEKLLRKNSKAVIQLSVHHGLSHRIIA